MTTFTSTGVSAASQAIAPGSTTVVLTNTSSFIGLVYAEISLDGGISWPVVEGAALTFGTMVAGPLTFTFPMLPSQLLRLHCYAYTSGTLTYTITPAAAVTAIQNLSAIGANLTLSNTGTLSLVASPALTNLNVAGAVAALPITSNLSITAGGSLDINTGPTIAIVQTSTAAVGEPLVINANTAAPAILSNTVAQFVGADGNGTRLEIRGWNATAAGTAPTIAGVRARGTEGSPSAVLAGDILMQMQGFGYGATGYSAGAQVNTALAAAENWTDTARGTEHLFAVTKNGSTTQTNVMLLSNAGILTVGGTTVSGTDNLQVTGGVQTDNLGVSGTLSAFPLASSLTLASGSLAVVASPPITNLNVSGTITALPTDSTLHLTAGTLGVTGSPALTNLNVAGTITALPLASSLTLASGSLAVAASPPITNLNVSGTITALPTDSTLHLTGGTLGATAPSLAAINLAVINSGTVSVGTTSAAAPSSFILSPGSANSINNAASTDINNAILSGATNTIGAVLNSVIDGGIQNTISASQASIIGGQANTITSGGGFSAIMGGTLNAVSGTTSGAGGSNNSVSGGASFAWGQQNSVSGNYAGAIGTQNTVTSSYGFAVNAENTVSGTGSTVHGVLGSDRGNNCAFIHSPTGFFIRGSAQYERYVFAANSSGSSTVRLTTDGAAAGAANVAALTAPAGAGSGMMFTAKFFAMDRTSGAALTWTFGASLITRGSTAASTAMSATNPGAVGGPTTSTPPTFAAAPTIAADTTNAGFNISIGPPVGNTDNWDYVCVLEGVYCS